MNAFTIILQLQLEHLNGNAIAIVTMHEITESPHHAPIDKRPLLHSSIEIEIDQDQSTNHHHTPITTPSLTSSTVCFATAVAHPFLASERSFVVSAAGRADRSVESGVARVARTPQESALGALELHWQVPGVGLGRPDRAHLEHRDARARARDCAQGPQRQRRPAAVASEQRERARHGVVGQDGALLGCARRQADAQRHDGRREHQHRVEQRRHAGRRRQQGGSDFVH
jgi:hypothetical protein